MRDFGPVKVVISGSGGNLGSALYRAFLEENRNRRYDYRVIGILDSKEEYDRFMVPVPDKEDSQLIHRHTPTEIYIVERGAKEFPIEAARAAEGADIWIYFRGLPTSALIPNVYPDQQALEKAKTESGLGERGLLVEANLPILVRDVKLANRYGADRYVVEGNPVPPLGRAAHIIGVQNGHIGFVCSAGTRTEAYRVGPQLLKEFRNEIQTNYHYMPSFEASDFVFYVGHGEELAVFDSDASHVGNVSVRNFVTGLDPANGKARMEKVIQAVHREPYIIRDMTKMTAQSAAPITVDYGEDLLGSPKIVVSDIFVKHSEAWGFPVEDTFASMQAYMGYGKEPIPVFNKLGDEAKKNVQEKLVILKNLNRKADALLQNLV